jgi:murein L,D-transpeptidase YcbB/YkuD
MRPLLSLALLGLWSCSSAPPAIPEPAPAPAAVQIAPRPEARLRAQARQARVAERPDAREVLEALDPDAPPQFLGPNLAAVLTICADAADEGWSETELGCPPLQRARLTARPGHHPGRLADQARVEVLAREVLLRYATLMRRARGPRPNVAPELLTRLNTGTPVSTLLAELRPAGHQYRRLKAAARHYRGMINRGETYTALPTTRILRRGSTGPGVALLRTRLTEEGFPSEPKVEHTEHFEHTLTTALAGFQRLHALEPAERVGPGTRRLFDRTPTERLAAVHRALYRWRAAPARAGFYVQINIPDYYGELWQDGQRKHRFRVVVGRSRIDEFGKRPDATPSLASKITEVVYNPFWNVPPRILEEEVLADPAVRDLYSQDERWYWLSEHGYEVRFPGTPSEYVRQLPGRHNALGRVKILFRNPYAIYLHDTPHRSLFKKSRRAFSHGCVRVQDPLKLARLLLERDGRYNPRKVRDWLSGAEPTRIELSRPIPIFVDYILVQVDDAGRVRFLDDLYRRHRTRRRKPVLY